MDNHEDKVRNIPLASAIFYLVHYLKVWALAVSADESSVVSAGADSVVTFWEDSTDEVERESEAKRQEAVHRFATSTCIHSAYSC